jgi:hypothetical protein
LGKPKVLFLDIETAPSLGWVWAKWQTDVIDFKRDWYILCFAYKWAEGPKVKAVGLDDMRGYRNDKENDKALVEELWQLLDEADIIVAHNGDSFDLRKINTRFLAHGLKPPSPYKTVDTLKIARKSFRFDSNKLDDLGRYLGIGRKLPHTGFHLWKGCMAGDRKAWDMMKRYNSHDVELLEKVYFIMRPWGKHPHVNEGIRERCPKCGSSEVQRRGYNYTLVSRKQKYQCHGCFCWFEGTTEKVK